MQEFKRARSDEQKGQRMADIKRATAELFAANPYHEITLTTIAEHLGWSRANLYKYVTTKEEIFLELAADARDAYYAGLLEALPPMLGDGPAELARAWAHVSEGNRAWPTYGSILLVIIETNVTVERLMTFKKGYYDGLDLLAERIGAPLGIDHDRFARLLNAVYNHEVGLVGSCLNNPLVAEAVGRLGIRRVSVDYERDLAEFIEMCLRHATQPGAVGVVGANGSPALAD